MLLNPNDIATHQVAVYISIPPYGWWNKPSWAQALTPLAPDGTWKCDITTGGEDPFATEILAVLVPQGYQPPLASGWQRLPDDLYQFPYADAQRFRRLSFAGSDWWVKRYHDPVDPGPNLFSDGNDNVWVDPNGHLHLAITEQDGKWTCSEVIAEASFGYGTYVFTVQANLNLLDENAVLALFTWDDLAPQFNYREIDVEILEVGQRS